MKNYVLEVQNELQNLKDTMTDEEFFSSDIFFRYLENYIKGSVQGWRRGKNIRVQNMFDPEGHMTACTDGYVIKNNTYDSIIQKMNDRSDKFYGNCGKVSHEIWHILFTNFQTHASHIEAWKSTEFNWLVQPTHPDADKVKIAINSNKNLKALMFKLMLEIANIYEDAYINIKGCLAMPGIPANGFIIYNNTLIKEYGTLNKILKNDVLLALLQIMHLKSMNAPLKMDAPLTDEEEDKYLFINNILDSASEYTEGLLYESNGKQRARLVDEVLICLYPLLEQLATNTQQQASGEREESESNENNDSSENSEGGKQCSSSNRESNDESSSSNSSSSLSNTEVEGENGSESCDASSSSTGNNDISEEDLNRLLKDIEEKMSETKMPEGNTTPIDDDFTKEDVKNKKEELSEKIESGTNGMDFDSAKKAFNSIESEVMEDISKRNVESEHRNDLKQEAKELLENLRQDSLKDLQADMEIFPGSPKDKLKYTGSMNYHYNVRRMTGISDRTVSSYEAELSSVDEYANITIRQLKKILKDQEKSMYASGYRMGGRFDAKSVARSEYYKDGRIFKKKTEKHNPEICFSLLIDESGSMFSSDKIRKARMTAILLEKVLSEMDIPLLITGHTQLHNDDVTMDIFKDFESIDGEDKYRLTEIEAQGNNVDGMAIAYNCEKMLQRNEKKKVLIVISDGLPAANGMSMSDSLQLAIDMVQKYRKKGIEIFGAVIDGEKDRIAQIYSDRTMDCTDLDTLSPELCGLVKRFIINR